MVGTLLAAFYASGGKKWWWKASLVGGAKATLPLDITGAPLDTDAALVNGTALVTGAALDTGAILLLAPLEEVVWLLVFFESSL